MTRIGVEEKQREVALKVRELAAAALKESDLESVFGAAGAYEVDETAGSALKGLLAEKTTEYIMKAMKVARKKNRRLGAAALIIAAEKERW
jgi:hypothetical protein